MSVATKRSAPVGTTWTLRIKDDWTPTAENINALPEPLRVFIHDLNTVCDPRGCARAIPAADRKPDVALGV